MVLLRAQWKQLAKFMLLGRNRKQTGGRDKGKEDPIIGDNLCLLQEPLVSHHCHHWQYASDVFTCQSALPLFIDFLFQYTSAIHHLLVSIATVHCHCSPM